MKTIHPKKASAKQLAEAFQKSTGCKTPPESKIYTCDTPSPVRAIAEFEPMGGVLIAYPGTVAQDDPQLPPTGPRAFGIPDELIIRMQQADSKEPVHIFIMCADKSQRDIIIKNLETSAAALKLKFNPAQVHLVPWDTDTYWTRDFGPWWVENKVTNYYSIAKHVYTTLGGGSVGLVDGAENVDPFLGFGIFRPNDEYGAVKFSDYLNAPVRAWNKASWGNKDPKKKLPQIDVHNWYFTGLLDVGGNYMVTGDGIIASSYLVATQNELPVEKESDVDGHCAAVIQKRMEYVTAQLNRFMGIRKYHVLSDPTGTYIGHIDCWGKFLAPRKVLIAKSQQADENAAFDKIAESFEQEGFEVFRVMCQDIYIPLLSWSEFQLDATQAATTAAYTNSLILNNHVYVPIAGDAYKNFDDDALAVYRKALPGYTVIGIPGKPENPWLGTDALHCRTRGIPRNVVNNWLKSQNLL